MLSAYEGNYTNTVYDLASNLYITGLAMSMAVNTLVTGLIVFRILKVLGVRLTSESVDSERTSSLGPTGVSNKYRHIIFVIIESAMALFAIQLVRVVLYYIPVSVVQLPFMMGAQDILIVINQMLNVIIIRSVHLYFYRFTDNIYLARESHQR